MVSGIGRRASTLVRPTPNGEGSRPLEPVPPPPVYHIENKLLQSSPFATGFMGAVGVMVAIGLASAVLQVQQVLILVVMSLFLSLGLNPAVEALIRRRVHRGIAVAIVAVVLLGVLGLGISSLVPILNEQISLLIANAPLLLENLRDHPTIADLDARYGVIGRVSELLTSQDLFSNLFGGLWGAGRIVANVVFSTIVTVVLTLYFLASLPAIKTWIYKLAPASRRDRARYLADEIMRGVGGYLTGMFVVVSVAAVCAFIFMNFAGLGTYSIALAFITAMFCFIPLVGSTLAMVVVALVGFGVSPTTGIATIIYFLCYQQFDAYVVYPNVMKRTVKLPGALVVLSAIIGGMLLGVIGALIAIPTAAALLLLHREVLQPYLDSH